MDSAPALAAALSVTIADRRVLAAIATVARDRFLAPELRARAFEDVSLPIGGGQRISQPWVVARMTELLALSGTERVLDVGTGSGYHAAVLAHCAREVISVERDPRLSAAAAGLLARLGIGNVTCVVGDGWSGLTDHAPFDAINVAANPGPVVPPALVAQLGPGGRLVVPLGDEAQRLTRLTRIGPATVVEQGFGPVRFVPLVPAGRPAYRSPAHPPERPADGA